MRKTFMGLLYAAGTSLVLFSCTKQKEITPAPDTNTNETAKKIPSEQHPANALLLSEEEYNKLPKVNFAQLALTSKNPITATEKSRGQRFLSAPPVGDQGTEGSCVGWGVGYAATSIIRYPDFNNWNTARRSPSYVYNQIKVGSCASGSYVSDALNLCKNQGVCSIVSMPYLDGQCYINPTNSQRNEASQNKVTGWSSLNRKDIKGIKQALDLGYPVPIAFDVTKAFDDMGNRDGIWDNNYGTVRGGHCTCIVGYDNKKKMFKVENSWGSNWGDNGYFWVTYDLVAGGCLSEIYTIN